jgi:diguanylate cyclase (GGDEF)-like protein
LHFSTHASENPPLPLEDYFTQTWSTHEGLPHNGINNITQTTDGYLWIATWEGLARFNGREFKLFTRGSEAKLPDSALKSLASLPSGELLVAGARGGLSMRKNRSWFPQKAASTMVNHAIFDNDLNIWLALEGKGLVFRNVEKNQETTIMSNLRAHKLLIDQENTVWVATDNGLFNIKNKTLVSQFNQHHGLPNAPVYSLLLSSNNQLIIGTGQGAFILNKGTFTPLHPTLLSESITSLLQDNNDDIWVGTQKHGIFRLSDNGLEKLDDNKGLPNNRISSLYQDKENSIWVGTSGGLFRLREAPFITLTSKQGLVGNYIRSVLSHSDGSLWVGSSKGLNKIVNRKISTINNQDKNKSISVLSLAQYKNNSVLVGSYNCGVFIVKNNELLPFLDKKQHLPSNEIRTLLYDSKENTWIGTASGLVKISKEGAFTHFNKTNGLPNNFIMALAEDKQGKIWIGTGVGIASYNNGTVQMYQLNEKFDAEYAFGFHVTQNAIWLATDRGLIHIDLQTNEMSAITKENGLPIDKLFQIVVDDKNTFWLTSNRGVIKISAEQINGALSGKLKTIDYEMFSEGVGLLSSQANGGSTPAATLHTDGSVWVATAKGVSQVNHQRLARVAEKKLPVVIEQLIVDGAEYPLLVTNNKNTLTQIPLLAGASRITIHYAGLGFLMSNSIQYQTQLLGFDNKWLDTKNQTYTEFTNLAPGEYTFKVRAKYPNGQWIDQDARLTFTIPFHFWQTALFKVFIIILFFLTLSLLFKYRVISIQRNEEKLKRLVEKQTLDLQQQAELFAYQASHDQLTGLSNRRAFDTWCDTDFTQTQQEQKPLSLAIIDIDHFKHVNDDYSHLVGDKVIKCFAKLFIQQIKCHSTQVKLARWGGEEFTLLIFDSKENALILCEKIRQTVQNYSFSEVAQDLKMTVSIGLTDNNTVNEYDKMINQADQALYYAKRHGRNQVRIYQRDDSTKNQKIDQRMNQVTRTKKRLE